MLYGKIKYTFEALVFLFYGVVFVFSFLNTFNEKESICLKFQGIFGLLIVSFSVASIKDRISPDTQNIVQFILGIIFLGILTYSFFVCLFQTKLDLLFYFSIVGVFIGIGRLLEFVFCTRPYLDYVSLQEEGEPV